MRIRTAVVVGIAVISLMSCKEGIDAPSASEGRHIARVTTADTNFACAINAAPGNEGPTWCWGANESGQLGNGTTTNSSTPVQLSIACCGYVAVGPHFACGLEATKNFAGNAYCWGANESGQLGNGTTTNSSTPVSVSGHGFGTIALTPIIK